MAAAAAEIRGGVLGRSCPDTPGTAAAAGDGRLPCFLRWKSREEKTIKIGRSKILFTKLFCLIYVDTYVSVSAVYQVRHVY